MIQEQDWTEAYKELCTIIKAQVTEIQHIDLYYEQLNYLPEEYPFPNHSLFIDMQVEEIETLAKNVQALKCMLTFYHVFYTLSDSFDTSENQSTALEFMPVNKKLHKALQGLSGTNFSPLDRKSNIRVPHQEGYLIIRAQAYESTIMDYSAMKEYTEHTVTAVGLNRNAAPPGSIDDIYKPDIS